MQYLYVIGEVAISNYRRLLKDDGRGVAEALNETVYVSDKCAGLTIQGKYYLRIDPLGEGSKWRRTYGQEIYSPFLLAFTEQVLQFCTIPESHPNLLQVLDTTNVSGICLMFGSSLVSWSSKKQPVVSRSTAEAELRP
ncbi:hypothetical protein AgCh_027533 [Apium graveolens]